MLLRTLEIPDDQGQSLNAVLLCGFIANTSGQQFLVYSLNEKVADDLIKIYLAPMEGEGLERSMCSASSEDMMTATAALKRIIHDACSPQARQTDNSYSVLDLTDTHIHCTRANLHHSLKVSEHWLMKLLVFNPDAKQDIERSATPADAHAHPQEYSSPTTPLSSPSESQPSVPYRVISHTPTAQEALSHDVIEHAPAVEQEPTHSQKIETNLKSLIASVTQHKETLLSKFVMLDERMRELKQREEDMAVRERSFDRREEELIAGMNALKMAEEQLNSLMKDG
ncbi:hypothetical protein BLL37_16340 [Pseudomonas azotoformans]|uniref:Uncharacterized protein n=1 Tax=Pseudomonas azotoformans TaxID=47878 RepID=A0A1V2JHQ5_PSEAZ|nr:hypothetical protein [Pseudomonas azotoformans]OIN46434.1 hypothetical protein BFL39_22295 [Pseudomonas azotoformans]ONH44890.1 hypothetical protein BLL37_16340 [Pseudomonas azotoformans]SDN10765.1 hypothetical protein SAMN04489799_1094 [Pseudomonas azotoformans]